MRSEKKIQLHSMLNAIRCIDQWFAFKKSRISCLALIFKLKNLSTTVLYAKKSVAVGEISRDIYSFFQAIDTNLWDSVVWVNGLDWMQRVERHGFNS